jgi:hypothetical protein
MTEWQAEFFWRCNSCSKVLGFAKAAAHGRRLRRKIAEESKLSESCLDSRATVALFLFFRKLSPAVRRSVWQIRKMG